MARTRLDHRSEHQAHERQTIALNIGYNDRYPIRHGNLDPVAYDSKRQAFGVDERGRYIFSGFEWGFFTDTRDFKAPASIRVSPAPIKPKPGRKVFNAPRFLAGYEN